MDLAVLGGIPPQTRKERLVRKMFLGVLLLACAVFSYNEARAAGFGLYEFSARGNALAGTTIARDATPGSMAMNPAQVARVPGLQIEAGMTTITAGADVTYDGHSQSTDRQYFFVPHTYMTWQINEKFSAGLGIFSRFGLGNSYPEDWVGATSIYDISVQSMSAQPTLAVNVNDWLSLGVGLEIMWFDIDIKNKIALGPAPVFGFDMGQVDSKISGDNYAIGGTLGVHLHPLDWLSIGVSYRTNIKQDVDGKAKFNKSDINPLVQPMFGQAFENMGAHGTIILPAQTAFGVAVTPWADWTFEVDAIFTQWSSFEELKIDFDDNLMQGLPRPPVTSSVKEKDWRDVWRLSVGVEYAATDWLDLRAGYTYDQSPMRGYAMDALIPAHDRHLFNVGAGFHMDEWSVDLAYNYLNAVSMSGHTVEGIPISYDNADGHMFAVTAGYEF